MSDSLTIGEAVTVERGTTYKSALIGAPGPVLLGLGTIQRNGGFRDDSLRTYGGDSPEKLLVRPGELYASLKDVTQSADLLGAVARVPADGPLGRLTQDTVRLDLTGVVSADYLYWILRTPQYREYCRAHATGTTNLGLPREDFFAFSFPAPSEALTSLVELLNVLEEKLESNRRIFDRVSALVDAKAAKLLDGAVEQCFLRDLVDFNRRKVKPGRADEEILYIDIASVSPGLVEPITPIAWSDAPSRARRGVADGDVIFSTVRPGRRSFALILDPDDRMVASTGFAVMTPEPRLGASMLTSIATSRHFAEYLESVAHGSAYPAVSVQAMGGYQFPLPSAGEISRFEDQTMWLRRRAHQAVVEVSRLAELRDALLSQLMVGGLPTLEGVA